MGVRRRRKPRARGWGRRTWHDDAEYEPGFTMVTPPRFSRSLLPDVVETAGASMRPLDVAVRVSIVFRKRGVGGSRR